MVRPAARRRTPTASTAPTAKPAAAMAADNRSPEVKSPAAAERVPNRATPTALPTCRATLKTAEAMPAPGGGRGLDDGGGGREGGHGLPETGGDQGEQQDGVGGVGPGGQPAEEAHGAQREPAGHRDVRAGAGGQAAEERGRDEPHAHRRQQGETGVQDAEAAFLLEVEGGQEEHAVVAEADQQADRGSRGERARAEQGRRQQWRTPTASGPFACFQAAFDQREGGQAGRARTERRQDRRGGPAV